MTIRTYIRTFLFLIASLILLACGSNNSSDSLSAEKQGKFIDSVVSGLRFETPTTSGFTDSQGQFRYRNGETVRFFVGDVFIGEAQGQAIITPVELIPGAIDEKNTQVQNIVMFLQSIDDDGDESNGINITNLASDIAKGKTVNFALSPIIFETDGAIQTLVNNMTSVNGIAWPMISRVQAVNAFRNNLFSLFAGNYQGSFAGDDTGTWTAVVDNNGNLTGIRKSDNFSDVEISGSIASSGESNISGNIDTAAFSGIFSRTGNVTGIWQDEDGSSGIFSGSRISASFPALANNPGRLTISGDDVNIIGASYVPALNPVVIKDTTANTGIVVVKWLQHIVSSAAFESRSMAFKFNENDGTLYSVIYARMTASSPGSGPISFYSYFLDCENDPQACLSITLDVAQKQVIFTDTRLAIDSDDGSASNVISLDGTLNW